MIVEVKYDIGQRVFFKDGNDYKIDTVQSWIVSSIGKNTNANANEVTQGYQIRYVLTNNHNRHMQENELYSDAKEFYKKHSERLATKHAEERKQLKEVLKVK